MINAMTIDVEDYFHVTAFAKTIHASQWGSFESRVHTNTMRILELLENANTKATFFVLGWVGERNPRLVREILGQGHEVACHGFSHKLIYTQSVKEFTQETARAKGLLEDITGNEVAGYRAASFSITAKSLWALDVLGKLGFCYDSSIVPAKHDVYGLTTASAVPHTLVLTDGSTLGEFPPSTLSVANYRVPIGGGGYFRFFPYWLSRWALKRINSRDEVPFSFYMHPWEIDPDQPRIATSLRSTFRHYNNLRKFEPRLERLLREFRFNTMKSCIDNIPLEEIDIRTLMSQT
jgi:polysaccharide deacetylase family protein (PEP-CTERM system associated)